MDTRQTKDFKATFWTTSTFSTLTLHSHHFPTLEVCFPKELWSNYGLLKEPSLTVLLCLKTLDENSLL